MFSKLDFKVVGAAFCGAAINRLNKPELYITAGALGLGAGLADKSVTTGLRVGCTATIGIIGYAAMCVIPELQEEITKVENKEEDI